MAVAQFQLWEGPPRHRSRNGVGLVVLIVILALIYFVLHAVRYQDCIVTPGLFDWPTQCL